MYQFKSKNLRDHTYFNVKKSKNSHNYTLLKKFFQLSSQR